MIFSIEGGGALPITAFLAGEIISSPNGLTNDADPVASPSRIIRADFVNPFDGFSPATTDLVSFSYISDGVGAGHLRAFDPFGILLDDALSIVGGNQLETLTVQASGISYITIQPDTDVLVDNFTFHEPLATIPEPSTHVLILTGLAAILITTRKRTHFAGPISLN